MILSGFRLIEPLYRTPQEKALAWLVQAHVKAQDLIDGGTVPGKAAERFESRMAALFRRYGCSPERIKTRGHDNPDYTHTDWEKMGLFRLSEKPQGATMTQRSDAFRATVDRVSKAAYDPSEPAPDHLIHVTCTGYISPSCAQELVVRNGWEKQTTVTHAYHMGCSAALPAVRMAGGFLAAGAARADIFHTEICSIHLQPQDHSPEQLVVQSLFADGFIRYTAQPESVFATWSGAGNSRGMRLIGLREVMVPETRSAITWECGEWGMRMGLSREVPETICAVLKPYLEDLAGAAKVPLAGLLTNAVFAVHPGGPKIIDQIQGLLGLSESQIAFSKAILRDRGNMSSATLPHIWEALLADSSISAGTPVVSLAFGPGLCISGAIFEVVGG